MTTGAFGSTTHYKFGDRSCCVPFCLHCLCPLSWVSAWPLVTWFTSCPIGHVPALCPNTAECRYLYSSHCRHQRLLILWLLQQLLEKHPLKVSWASLQVICRSVSSMWADIYLTLLTDASHQPNNRAWRGGDANEWRNATQQAWHSVGAEAFLSFFPCCGYTLVSCIGDSRTLLCTLQAFTVVSTSLWAPEGDPSDYQIAWHLGSA
jgi:cation transport regulator ChaB